MGTTTLIPLGTSAALPLRNRHFSAVALQWAGRLLLFDCGEGTQFQLLRAGLKAPRIEALFLTHLHGDHWYGLPGLLATLGMVGHARPLTLVGPHGLAACLAALPGMDAQPFPLLFVELDEGFGQGIVYETAAFTVEARPLAHTVFTVGYRFQERTRPGNLIPDALRHLGVTDYAHLRQLKAGHAVTLPDGRTVRPQDVTGPSKPGVSFAYVTDTRPCEGGRLLARGVDLLYHEATFAEAHRDRAVETGHSTAREAAGVARAAGARRLLLGHFSARYPDPAVLVAEARTVFQNTEAAMELEAYSPHENEEDVASPPQPDTPRL
jgi:ribonuclease Z